MGNRWGGAASYAVATDEPFPIPLPAANPEFEVGVIDSGIVLKDERPHPPLDGHLTNDWPSNVDTLPEDGSMLDEIVGHGTFVAGRILLAAPSVTIRMRKVLNDPDGADIDHATANAIREFADVPNLKVVNMSFFGPLGRRVEPMVIKNAIQELVDKKNGNVVIVAAAGNYWTDQKSWPAAFTKDFRQVISVGAIDNTVITNGLIEPPRASFSSYGPWVDVYLPGVQVLGPRCTYRETVLAGHRRPQNYTGSCRWSGTSFAAATVTGLVAQALLDRKTTYEQAKQYIVGKSAELSTSET
jgi:subtilisin family serine protease